MDAALADAVAEVQGWLAEARRIVALTGAGISTDSGIADFRGPNGLWTKDPSAEKASHIDHYLGAPDVRRLAWRLPPEPPLAAAPNPAPNALVAPEPTARLNQTL